MAPSATDSSRRVARLVLTTAYDIDTETARLGKGRIVNQPDRSDLDVDGRIRRKCSLILCRCGYGLGRDSGIDANTEDLIANRISITNIWLDYGLPRRGPHRT